MSEKQLTQHWLNNYSPHGACGLCGNLGWLDTRGVKTPAGKHVGDLFWCICPNGQEFRRQVGGQGPMHLTELKG